MNFKYAAIGLAGLASVALSVATPAATIDVVGVHFTYDPLTTFGGPGVGISGTEVSFEWSFSTSVGVAGSLASAQNVYTLPGFSVSALPGYQLSGPVSGFIGNLAYVETGDAVVTATVKGTATLNSIALPGSPLTASLDHNPTLSFLGGQSGYLAAGATLGVGNFTQFAFDNATLTLSVAQGANPGLGLVTATDQNKYRVTFNVTAVPVPLPGAVWLLAPAALSLVTRRRPNV